MVHLKHVHADLCSRCVVADKRETFDEFHSAAAQCEKFGKSRNLSECNEH